MILSHHGEKEAQLDLFTALSHTNSCENKTERYTYRRKNREENVFLPLRAIIETLVDTQNFFLPRRGCLFPLSSFLFRARV